jgi:CRP-like cAMP-binding protein
MSKNLDRLRLILSKPYGSRTNEDLKEIGSYISNIKFFNNLKENRSVFNECCMYINYEFFHEGDYIFHLGDIGDKFYILIQGEASVIVPVKTDNKIEMKEVFVYSDGSSFGEVALQEQKPRTATILTKSSCHIAVLDKANYQRILASLMKKKKLETVDFLKTQQLFKKLTKGSLEKLCYCFEEKIYKKDHVIYTENTPIDYLYIIRQGDVTLSNKLKCKLMGHDIHNKYKNQLNKSYNHKVGISVLGKGEFLGLYDIDSGVFSNTATCVSAIVVLLQISFNDFKRRINNQESMAIINQRRKLKDAIHGASILSVKKVIKSKESSPYRIIQLNEENSESTNSGVIEPNTLSPTSTLDQKTSRKLFGNYLKSSKNMKPDKSIEEIERSTSALRLDSKTALSTKKHSAINLQKINISEKNINKPFCTLSEEQAFDISPARIISRLEPFGRVKRVSNKKPIELKNIHVQTRKSSARVPSNQSFRFIKHSPTRFI